MFAGLIIWWLADESLTKASMIRYLSLKIEKHSEQKELPSNPTVSALVQAIENRRKEDPLIGAKIGAKEVYHHVLSLLKDEKGVHIQSLFCALGALAGYACQASIRAQAEALKKPESTVFLVATTKDGKKFYFGDLLNKPLAEDKLSVWSLAAAAAQQNGCATLLDVENIFKHATESVGSDSFGIPRVPEFHRAGDLPVNYVKVLWPIVLPIAKVFCINPAEWPILFGLAIQEAMGASKEVIAADMALQIVMESAIPISKVDLVTA